MGEEKDVHMISGDLNAKLPIWHSKTTDKRGEEVGEFMFRIHMNILNTEGDIYTYYSIHGEENIDITFVSERVKNESENWMVEPSISDHNKISYEWKIGRNKIRLHLLVKDKEIVKQWGIEEKIERSNKILIDTCKQKIRTRGGNT
ncbi:hypothetical protein PR048_011962 [Dryococelus australis]|uniref:Endonuclease/exonuclease/phosphatase domain-containing protein n=1 Tax=Dryococelus australis TaxID=614101 RepID=A0ABQ9HN58_9NEOP|nr:hypothetical protein PR048_011962 [Dryococelus australis]